MAVPQRNNTKGAGTTLQMRAKSQGSLKHRSKLKTRTRTHY